MEKLLNACFPIKVTKMVISSVSTAYQSLYWANSLSLQGASGALESLSRSIASARVDLNPHQVDAALFAVRSPLSKGVLLADEVGLGKTIEAGLVLSQRWAERKRKILLILPATLRKQWQQELEEKFSLSTMILETASFKAALKAGLLNPFEQKDRVVICSYQFASAKRLEMGLVAWDLIVIDEAHRLRNVYKASNKMANNIKMALENKPKVLLTATPLQNSLLELFGLVSVIDPHVFGDIDSFREQFMRPQNEQGRNKQLRERLQTVCKRTLRKQVLEYVQFTKRIPLTQEFTPSDDEQNLYEQVSSYLQREQLTALPASQRSLMTLVLRKLLASSTFAIGGTLEKLVQRLLDIQKRSAVSTELTVALEDFEGLEELEEEWQESEEKPEETSKNSELILLEEELRALQDYAALAKRIRNNAKGSALLIALKTALDRADELGAARKAVVFTESRRTQEYLQSLLEESGYAGQTVLINGTNTDSQSKKIYQRWCQRHAGSDLISNSRTADTKAAIVEEFRNHATILIATESAAEGVNLQFCSLVVNYDLPWNPQRIEQRIGRCHRYGQKHDVVVVNFLNARNEADQRVYQLLEEKFKLFDGVFGASDEVLGVLESGVDFEKRIAQVYQTCRTPTEIKAGFDALQAALEAEIQNRMSQTRQTLLDHFDEDVHKRLKMRQEEAKATLETRQQTLLEMTRYELGLRAEFDQKRSCFFYTNAQNERKCYCLHWQDVTALEANFYNQEHPVAQELIQNALGRQLPPAQLEFNLTKHPSKISALEALIGQRGWLEVSKLSVQSLETEEFLILAAKTENDEILDQELCHKLLGIDAREVRVIDQTIDQTINQTQSLEEVRIPLVTERLGEVDARNAKHFDEEVQKLDHWAEDLKFGLEREIKDLDREIRETRRNASLAITLADKLEGQKLIKTLEANRTKKRRDLYDSQDEIDQRRAVLIESVEGQLTSKIKLEQLFVIQWCIV